MKTLLLAAVLVAGLRAQSPVTVTPTLVSIQLGQPIYCAANWLKASQQIQVYCYSSSANHTWDLLIFNSIFYVVTTVTLPYVIPCPTPSACDFAHGVLWMLRPNTTTSGAIDWQVAWSGTRQQSGTFQ